MEQYAGFNVHFDELVHADTIAMRKATFEKLSGAKVVDYSPPVESLLSQERVTELRDKLTAQHPQEAREEAMLEAMDPENPQTEPCEDAEAAIPVHDATDLGVLIPSDTDGGANAFGPAGAVSDGRTFEYLNPPAPEITDEQLLALDQEHKEVEPAESDPICSVAWDPPHEVRTISGKVQGE